MAAAPTPARQPSPASRAPAKARARRSPRGRLAAREPAGATRSRSRDPSAGRANAAAAPGARAERRATPRATPAVAASLASKDPRFSRLITRVEAAAARVLEHPPATRRAAEAQAAAPPPSGEARSLAERAKVDAMDGVRPKKAKTDGFLDQLLAAIDECKPRELGQTESFMKRGEKEALKKGVSKAVRQASSDAAEPLSSAATTEPDPSQLRGKEVTPLPRAGAATSVAIAPDGAVPAPRPDSEVSLAPSARGVDDRLAKSELAPEQLRRASDPRFSAVLTTRSAVVDHAAASTGRYRQAESAALDAERTAAAEALSAGRAKMSRARGLSQAGVAAEQAAAIDRDRAARQEVVDKIEKIYGETKAAVEAKLERLGRDVNDLFDKGVDRAIESMTDTVNARLDVYKYDRYFKYPWGPLAWVKDQCVGLPDEVEELYAAGRKQFEGDLRVLAVSIAKVVEARLDEAKREVASGRERIGRFVDGLPRALRGVGESAASSIGGRFDELERSIEEKKSELARGLAQKYQQASERSTAALQKIRDENKGLVQVFVEKVGEVLKALAEFKARLLRILGKAADSIKRIIADPIGFLKNLLSAIKKGFSQFVDRIWEHLKAGLIGWLFGTLAQAGVEIPTDASLPSLLKLVLGVLGLTYDRLRAKAAKLLGDRNVALLERAFAIIKRLMTSSPAELWEEMKASLGDLRAQVLDGIKSWVITAVIKAAVVKLVSMFNPAGAIIQAVLTIYNTVMFFIERASQIVALIEAIVESIHKIVVGDLAAAASWIERSMARTIPLIISFLARLLGLGGIADTIKSIIMKIQAKVDAAIDKLLAKIVAGVKKLLGKGEAKSATEASKAHDAAWAAAVSKITKELHAMSADGLKQDEVDAAIGRWKKTYKFKTLSAKLVKNAWRVFGSMSPEREVASEPVAGDEQNPLEIEWPKPPAKNYPVLYFGGLRSQKTTQENLKELKTQKKTDDSGHAVKAYRPCEKSKLPGGEVIGLAAHRQLDLSSVVGPLSISTTPGGHVINDVLSRYGFDPSYEKLDGDHVCEIQFGGENELSNLWPLDRSTNRGAGSKLKGESAKDSKSGAMWKIPDLKEQVRKFGRKIYFKITAFV
jgi:hypothetical protein